MKTRQETLSLNSLFMLCLLLLLGSTNTFGQEAAVKIDFWFEGDKCSYTYCDVRPSFDCVTHGVGNTAILTFTKSNFCQFIQNSNVDLYTGCFDDVDRVGYITGRSIRELILDNSAISGGLYNGHTHDFLYYASAKLLLSLTQPALVGTSISGTCSNELITAEAHSDDILCGEFIGVGNRYHEWYYKLQGDFSWTPIPYGFYTENVNGSTKVRCSIEQLRPGAVTQSTDVYFKVVSRSSLALFTEASSEILAFSVRPAPPTLFGYVNGNILSSSLSTPSCSGLATGTLSLTGISAPSGSGRYILRRGHNSTSCNLSEDASCLANVQGRGTFSGSVLTIDNLPAGNYTLLLANPGASAGACYSWYNLTIGVLPPLSFTSASANPTTCYGASDGSLTLNYTNGSLPLQVLLNGTPHSNSSTRSFTISNLAAGTYTVGVTDQCGTIDSRTLTISSPSPTPTISSVTPIQPTCSIPGNGSIDVVLSGASGQLLNLKAYYKASPVASEVLCYDVSSTSTTRTLSDLNSGSYRLVLSDADHPGCGTAETTLILSDPSSLSLTAIPANVSCNGGTNGSLTLSGSGCPQGYRYSLNGVDWQSSSTYTSLSAGSYTAYVSRNVAGCTDQASIPVAITEPAPLQATVNITPILCNESVGGGQFSATITGGTPPYTYHWLEDNTEIETGVLITPTFTRSGLEGSYQLQVQDDKGCAVSTVTCPIIRPAVLSTVGVPTVTQPQCYGEFGYISGLAASGGTTPYAYEYQPTGGSSWAPLTVATPFTSGSYRIRVKDANGCTLAYDDELSVINIPSALTFILTPSNYNGLNISCYGLTDGAISITATGGQAPYTYKLDGGAYGSTASFTNLPAGSYTVYVKDALGCEHSSVITLQQSIAPIGLSVSDVGDVDCGESLNGHIQLSATGGSGSYLYSKDRATWQAASRFNGLSAGHYTLSVKDQNGCSAQVAATVQNTGSLAVSVFTYQGALCAEQADGWVILSAVGGSGSGYQYNLDNGTWQSSTRFDNLSAGLHTFKVRDDNGCSNFTDFTVPTTTTLTLTLQSKTDASCLAAANGSVTLAASGGAGGYTYSYGATGTSWQSGTTFSNLTVGSHTLRVKDAGGCTASLSIAIVSLSTLQLSIAEEVQLACVESRIGAIRVQATGGNAPYRYRIDGGAWQAADRFSSLGVGSYTLEVEDASGCTNTASSTLSASLPALNFTTSVTDVFCYGNSTGAITATPVGGTPPYSYSWQGSTASSSTLSGLRAGSYMLTVTDAGGCSTSSSSNIQQPTAALSAAATTKPVCPSSSSGIITVQATGGTVPYTYEAGGLPQTSPVLAGKAVGRYTVNVADAKGCTTTVDATIVQNSLSPNVNFLVSTLQNAIDTLTVKEISVPAPDSIRWEFDAAARVLAAGASPIISFAQAGSYHIKLIAYYSGCDFVTEKRITIQPYDAQLAELSSSNRGFESLIAFPNPNSGTFTVRAVLKTKQTLRLQLYDISGRLYLNKSMDTQRYEDLIAIPNLPAGVYILRGLTEGEVRQFKLIVQ